MQGSTLGILLNFYAKNPPYRKAVTVNGHCKTRIDKVSNEKKKEKRMIMTTIFNPEVREELIRRIGLVNEFSNPVWGKMNVYQMVKHNTYWNVWVTGKDKQVYKQELPGRIFGKFALKKMIKNEKPFDKNIPTSDQFKVKELNGNLASEKDNWISLVNEYEHFNNPGFIHDFFGKMTIEQIGTLVYKHTDHHLRQFGV